MSTEQARRIDFAVDSGKPTPVLLAALSPTERDLVVRLPTERQRRHSAVARQAGKSAVRRTLGPLHLGSTVEILKAPNGEPLVSIDGDASIVSISLAHSSQMAAAFAWRDDSTGGYHAGVDLEHIKPTEVASSPYAFSRRERMLISNTPLGLSYSGLAAWAVKEAAWKTLRPEVECGPDTIEIQSLDLTSGYAILMPQGRLRRRFGDARIRACLITVPGPDGAYILSLAELAMSGTRSS